MSRGRKYKEKAAQLDRDKKYTPNEAVKLLKELKYANFDETVEVHFNLGIDPRHADQQLRGTLSLPHGTGKKVRVAVIAQAENVDIAKKAGATDVGGEDLIEKIQSGWFDFDILLTTPDMMAKVSKLGRLLGAKGLMPNPKSGTVVQDIEKAVNDFMHGKVEYRNDKFGIVHLMLGKVSFEDNKIIENFESVYETLLKVKPSKAKGTYFKTIVLSSTMGQGLSLETQKVNWDK